MLSEKMEKEILELCKIEGLEDVSLFYKNTSSVFISVTEDKIDKYNSSENVGINISANIDGFKSETYIEKIDMDAIKEAISNMKNTSAINKKDYKKLENTKTNECAEVENTTYLSALDIDINQVAQVLKRCYSQAIVLYEKISSVPAVTFEHHSSTTILMRQDEERITDTESYCNGSIAIVSIENGRKSDGNAYQVAKKFSDIDYDDMMKEAFNESIAMLYAESIPTGKYTTVIRNNVVADLFAFFLPEFYQKSIKDKISKFENQIGEKVANEMISIYENPLSDQAVFFRNYDDEGKKTSKKYLIEKGILKNIVNSSSDKTEEQNFTANAYRDSYKSSAGTSLTNCFIEGGEYTTDEMIKNYGDCMVISSVDGIFAGANTANGDFSLISKGYLYEGGKRKGSVEQITINGNFYDLLKNIDQLSSDRYSNYYYGGPFLLAPAIGVKEFMIGGL